MKANQENKTRQKWTKVLIPFLMLTLNACIHNLARTDARIQSGGDITISGGYQSTIGGDEGTKETGGYGEVDLQFGKRFESNFGIALQLKVPMAYIATALDLYVEMPSSKSWYYGFGLEAGLISGVYGVITKELSTTTSLSITERVLTDFDGFNYNSQASANFRIPGDHTISLFLSHAYAPQGIGRNDDHIPQNAVYGGMAFRF